MKKWNLIKNKFFSQIFFKFFKIGKNENENCLGVACRWNYINIIEILLKTKRFLYSHVKEIINNKEINKNVKLLLENYLKKIKNKNICYCFWRMIFLSLLIKRKFNSKMFIEELDYLYLWFFVNKVI